MPKDMINDEIGREEERERERETRKKMTTFRFRFPLRLLLLSMLLLSFHPDGVVDCRAEKNDFGDSEEQRLVDRFSLPLTNTNDDGTESSSSETWAKYERRKPGEKNTMQTYFWSETRGVSQWEDPRLRRVNNKVAGKKERENVFVERGGGAKEDDDAKTAAETAAKIVREAARRKREATETKEKERIGLIEQKRRQREDDDARRDADGVFERMERMRKEKEAKERARRKEKEEKTVVTGGERKEAPFVVSAAAAAHNAAGTPKTPPPDSNAKEEDKKRKKGLAAPNPLPEPEHHDDVNPDHALNLDDHADVPKRHAPFVDGVVAQFFVFAVTTASLWLKTLFRKLGEYRAAKRREREENEKGIGFRLCQRRCTFVGLI